MNWITENIAAFGYTAVVILMALESANIPIPSEIILTFAGFLVAQGSANFHGMAFAGGFGCLLGSVVSYYLGKKWGRVLVEKYGKWIFITSKQIALGDRWMKKYGNYASFFSRLLPVVRTFISFVAGIWGAPFAAFAFLSFVGSLIWSYLLVYVGIMLGQNWEMLHPIWQKFDIVIVGLGVIGFAGYLYYHWREAKKSAQR